MFSQNLLQIPKRLHVIPVTYLAHHICNRALHRWLSYLMCAVVVGDSFANDCHVLGLGDKVTHCIDQVLHEILSKRDVRRCQGFPHFAQITHTESFELKFQIGTHFRNTYPLAVHDQR